MHFCLTKFLKAHFPSENIDTIYLMKVIVILVDCLLINDEGYHIIYLNTDNYKCNVFYVSVKYKCIMFSKTFICRSLHV